MSKLIQKQTYFGQNFVDIKYKIPRKTKYDI